MLEKRKGVNMRVNTKDKGDVFGEVSLLYNCPRTATVAATTDAVVWVLERDVFRCARSCGALAGVLAAAWGGVRHYCIIWGACCKWPAQSRLLPALQCGGKRHIVTPRDYLVFAITVERRQHLSRGQCHNVLRGHH